MTWSRRPGGDERRVDLDLAADDQRVVVGQDRREAVAGRGRAAHRRRGARGGVRRPRGRWVRRRGSSRRRGGSTACRAPRLDSSAAALGGGDGRPRPRPAGPARARPPRGCRWRRGSRSTVTEPRWPSRKIWPVSLPWPPARTRPRALIAALNAFQSRPSGARRGHGLRREALVGEELEAEGPRPARDAAAHATWRAKTPACPRVHEPEALVDLEDDRDRRRPRRLAVGASLAVAFGGRGRSAASSPSPSPPSPLRRRDHRQARGRHPRLLRPGHDDVDAPARPSRTGRRRAPRRCRRG